MEVVHDEAKRRFEIDLDGQRAVLDYRLTGSSAAFTHTGVPREFEGRGIGAKLVKAGLEWAREKGYKIVPHCSFVAVYIQRHPEWQPHVESQSK